MNNYVCMYYQMSKKELYINLAKWTCGGNGIESGIDSHAIKDSKTGFLTTERYLGPKV